MIFGVDELVINNRQPPSQLVRETEKREFVKKMKCHSALYRMRSIHRRQQRFESRSFGGCIVAINNYFVYIPEALPCNDEDDEVITTLSTLFPSPVRTEADGCLSPTTRPPTTKPPTTRPQLHRSRKKLQSTTTGWKWLEWTFQHYQLSDCSQFICQTYFMCKRPQWFQN